MKEVLITNGSNPQPEIWKPVVGYEGFYEVSNLGRIRSVARLCKQYQGKRKVPSKILKHNHNVWGYQLVSLCKLGIKKTKSVHSLVANAFLSEHDLSKDEVNHKDGNKDNNHVENLEWLTCTENKIHAVKMGLLKPRGEDNAQAKLTIKDVKLIRFLSKCKYITFTHLGKLFGVSRTNISHIIKRDLWAHVV